MDKDVDARVDVTGQCCPLPLIELAQAMAVLAPGQTLEIRGNDPIFESSVRDFCTSNGHEVIAAAAADDRSVSIVILAGGSP